MNLIELETTSGTRCAIRPEFITHMLELRTGTTEIWYGEKSITVDADFEDLLGLIADCLNNERSE